MENPGGESRGVAGEEELYERETELAALSRALTAAQAGSGGVVLVEGPPGIGKSRLLSKACAVAGSLGVTVLTARGSDLECDAPFGVAAELFAPPLAAATDTERQRVLRGHASLAGALFDPAARFPEDPSAIVRGLYWLTVSLASGSLGDEDRAVLLIAVDDAQWADRPSLSYLAYLAARIGELPAVLVIAVRSGEEATIRRALGLLRDHSAWVLKLRGLSPNAVARMVQRELPAAEPAFTSACAQVSGGNPFLARELLRALHADGVVPIADSVPRVRSLVPDMVLHSVLARLDRLGGYAERLVRAVAVLGDKATLRHARMLADLDPVPAEKAADALAGAHILAPGEPLRFTHPLIAASVHANMPAFARSRAHRRAADVLMSDGSPVDSIAAHLLVTRPDGDQQTVATLRESAAQAMAKGDPRAAARLVGRALAEPPVPGGRGRVLLELANAEIEYGGDGAAGHIHEALQLFEAPADKARALADLGRLRFNQGQHEAAATALDDAMSLLKPDDPAFTALLVSYLTATTFRESLHPLGTERLRLVMAAAEAGQPPDDPGLLAHVVLRLAFAGRPAAKVRELAACATAADPLIDPASLGILTGMVVQALCCVDELDAAERISESALAAARVRGSLLNFSMASYHQAIARYYRGELAAALADLDQAQTASREGWTAGDPWSGSLRVHIHVARGDLTAARGALVMTAAAAPGSMDLPVALFARATLALAEGRPDAALPDAEAAGQVLDAGFGIDHPGFVPWRRPAALAAHALGQSDRARALASELIERARWSGTARAVGLALRTQAAIVKGESRLRLLAEAAEALAHSPSALERAYALIELGTARCRAGQRSAAGAPLREGLRLAEHIGATPLIQAARHELHALGVRPRRLGVIGPGALTPAERRVAELAASGLTNRQAAEALFVTVKTVETHLTRAYQKLGINTRAELTQAIGPAAGRPAGGNA